MRDSIVAAASDLRDGVGESTGVSGGVIDDAQILNGVAQILTRILGDSRTASVGDNGRQQDHAH